MIRDFILNILSFLIIEPFQAELGQKLNGAQAPAAVIQQVEGCARAAAPMLADKALGDWWWTGTTAVYITMACKRPSRCWLIWFRLADPLFGAAQPFLSSVRS